MSTTCNVTFHLTYAFQYCGPDYPGGSQWDATYLPCRKVPTCCRTSPSDPDCNEFNTRGEPNPNCGEIVTALPFSDVTLGDGSIIQDIAGVFKSFSVSNSYAVFEATFYHEYESSGGFTCTASNAGSAPCEYRVRAANRERPKPCSGLAYDANSLSAAAFNCQINNFRASYGFEVKVTNLAIASGSPQVTMFPVVQIFRNQPQPVTIDIPTADSSGQQVNFDWFGGIRFDAGPVLFDANLYVFSLSCTRSFILSLLHTHMYILGTILRNGLRVLWLELLVEAVLLTTNFT
ncbi:hypothetical protein OAV88_01930 [bacterium]|nr:hypothetical protein [bacterium]